jgi:hypothetical protein
MMDANNSAQSRDVFDSQLIEQVHEGMRVFDVNGKEIGKVDDVRMGDPSAVTDEGESHTMTTPDVDAVASRTGAVLGVDDDDLGPKVPDPERSRMLRMGFLKVESGGILGIGAKERYVRADQIASVMGDRVTLRVAEDELVGEHHDDRPLAA